MTLPKISLETISATAAQATRKPMDMFAVESMMDLMQEHDDVVREHERECDIEYRQLVLGITDSPNHVLCNELEKEKSLRVSYFLGSLALFVLSGLSGLVMVLPYDDSNPKQPPLGGQLR